MTEYIIALVTVVVTWILGVLAKKSDKISDNLIPIQNLAIGVIVTIIEFIITKDFSIAIAISGLTAGRSIRYCKQFKKNEGY